MEKIKYKLLIFMSIFFLITGINVVAFVKYKNTADTIGGYPGMRCVQKILDEEKKAEWSKAAEFYEKQDIVKAVYVTTYYQGISMLRDVDNGTARSYTLGVDTYDGRYDDYVLGDKKTELLENEVIIPKYYTPGNKKKYNSDGYIDGDTLIGKNINFEYIKYDDNDEEYYVTGQLKVVGTYDNRACGMEGSDVCILVSDKCKGNISLWGTDKSEPEIFDYTMDIEYYNTEDIPEEINSMEEFVPGKDAPEGFDDMAFTRQLCASVEMQGAYKTAIEKKNNSFRIAGILMIIFIIFVVGTLAFYKMKKLSKESIKEIYINMAVAFLISLVGSIYMVLK